MRPGISTLLVAAAVFVGGLATASTAVAAPIGHVSQSRMNFGEVLSRSSKSETITIENSGTEPLKIEGLHITSAIFFDAFSFSTAPPSVGFASPCQNIELQPASACEERVIFEPDSQGLKQATLTFESNSSVPIEVELEGVGVAGPIPYIAQPQAFPEWIAGRGGGPGVYVTALNDGEGPYAVESVRVAGSDPADFTIISDECTGHSVSGPTGYCHVNVRFTPASAGRRTATFEMRTSAGTLTTSLEGTARANPEIFPIPSANLGTAPIGAGASFARLLTISSLGSELVTIESITLLGEARSEFRLAGRCVGPLVPVGVPCLESVSFAPESVGIKRAEIKITTNFGYEVVKLEGEGVNGALLGAVPSLEFSPLPALAGSASSMSLVVRNIGTSPTTLQGATISAADPLEAESFSIAEDSCPSVLQLIEACEIEVEFEPKEIGALTASLSLPNSSPSSPLTVELSGEGLANAGIGTAASALDFGTRTVGEGPGGAQTVTVESTGTTPLSVGAVELAGAGAGAFELGADSCLGVALEPSEGCAIEVRFAPTAAGAQSAELEISSDAGSEPKVITLSGEAEAPATTTTTTTTTTTESLPPEKVSEPPAVVVEKKAPPPACVEPTVTRLAPYTVTRKATPGVAGVRARFATDAATTIAVDASLVYRDAGGTHTVALGRRTVDVLSTYANFKAPLPPSLRQALPPGTKVTLKLRYAVAPTAACSSPGPTATRSLATEVVRVSR